VKYKTKMLKRWQRGNEYHYNRLIGLLPEKRLRGAVNPALLQAKVGSYATPKG